eukprot:TRINITY_DN30902_c0_g1_i1.p1 TRINITY_DN30902_c0_g1~~TRINITY_DN30902_c0_g1_i1.p1  ORF type:complete len:1154 (+),score=234.40 TRINITY_DN30902_c0_g1_i1:35-3463(+)
MCMMAVDGSLASGVCLSLVSDDEEVEVSDFRLQESGASRLRTPKTRSKGSDSNDRTISCSREPSEGTLNKTRKSDTSSRNDKNRRSKSTKSDRRKTNQHQQQQREQQSVSWGAQECRNLTAARQSAEACVDELRRKLQHAMFQESQARKQLNEAKGHLSSNEGQKHQAQRMAEWALKHPQEVPYSVSTAPSASSFKAGDRVAIDVSRAPPQLHYLRESQYVIQYVMAGKGLLVRLVDGNAQWLPLDAVEKIIPRACSREAVASSNSRFQQGDLVRRCFEDVAKQHGHGVGSFFLHGDQGAVKSVEAGAIVVSVGSRDCRVPAQELCSEAEWHHRTVRRCEEQAFTLEAAVEASESGLAQALEAVKHARGALALQQENHTKVSKALDQATKDAKVVRLVTAVRFQDPNVVPRAWRDISRCVALEWAVAISDRLRSSPPFLVPLEHIQQEVQSMVKDKNIANDQFHVFIVAGEVQRLCRADSPVPLYISTKDATAILEALKAGSSPPAELHSFTFLKAALGALDDVVLEPRVQEFFDSPHTGIIRVKDVPVPGALEQCLRPYQVVGYRWLVNNARNGFGCILADDMGLGKTIQAIALMLYMKENSMLEYPILVVVPKSLLSTWCKEIARWAKSELSVHVYHGQQRQLLANAAACCDGEGNAELCEAAQPLQKRARVAKQESQSCNDDAPPASSREALSKQRRSKVVPVLSKIARADVMLTSYGTFRSDVNLLLSKQKFSGLVLDEAQQIKNCSSQVSKAAKIMASSVGSIRMALSGTPVENRLADLHSQFEFILPGYLASSRADFEKNFGQPLAAAVRKGTITQAHVAERQQLLRKMTQPFVLRRLKTDKAIISDLPPKVEQTHECELSSYQERLYAAVQERHLQKTAEAAGSSSIARRGQVLAMLHALRQVCNHPECLSKDCWPGDLKYQAPAHAVEDSGKCAKLQELLEHILESNEKVIIFSCYLSTVDLLVAQIKKCWNIRVLKLVGAMDKQARDAAVQSFQTDPVCPVLILSLQAGGVGLTLTAATHVVHFDRCYNPARENQATDRAHRIGQNKTVFVHRLVTKDTFEERLSEIIEDKQKLSDLMELSGEDWVADLGDAELRSLFALSSASAGPFQGTHTVEATPSPSKRRRPCNEDSDS